VKDRHPPLLAPFGHRSDGDEALLLEATLISLASGKIWAFDPERTSFEPKFSNPGGSRTGVPVIEASIYVADPT
jgi:hypothetical protein